MQPKVSLSANSSSKKYDVLTALGAYACVGDKHLQRRVLRFLTVITARYNWQRQELSIGRRELATLWNVNERTVKRDLAHLKANGWLTVRRPAARGRVTAFSIDWSKVLSDTSSVWSNVGPDFEARMRTMLGQAPEATEPPRVVAFPQPPTGSEDWDLARAVLHRQDPSFYASWLAQLKKTKVAQGVLHLSAPSQFHARYVMTHAHANLERAVKDTMPDIHRVIVLCD